MSFTLTEVVKAIRDFPTYETAAKHTGATAINRPPLPRRGAQWSGDLARMPLRPQEPGSIVDHVDPPTTGHARPAGSHCPRSPSQMGVAHRMDESLLALRYCSGRQFVAAL
ncbi:hypothetical protein SCHPADRAFT_887204 [Schizopora paradoxa]|uniref:Uncharacterized protein n=1 Tax=Schizopora paradoxa TaxID=27342 RepID=A0A0H2RYS3_9AGAM|nr:hypothetical protein SCHPADRAFT_887204 [Schizopora paradoxa]